MGEPQEQQDLEDFGARQLQTEVLREASPESMADGTDRRCTKIGLRIDKHILKE